MATRRLIILGAILVLIALTIGILVYFAKALSYTASDVFWYGAMAGFLGCLLLVFLALIVFLAYRLRTK